MLPLSTPLTSDPRFASFHLLIEILKCAMSPDTTIGLEKNPLPPSSF